MIDPELQLLEAAIAVRDAALPWSITPAEARAVLDQPWPGPHIPVAEVRDLMMSTGTRQVPCRLYHPHPTDTLPLTLFFHGGGWALGTLDTHDRLARAIAVETGCAVLAVGYRLAPEHRFPAGLEDCVAVARSVDKWAGSLRAHPRNFALCGDSAGANLATVVARRLVGSANPPVHQVLLYPITDSDFARPSYAIGGGGLSSEIIEWFWQHYCTPEQRQHSDAAPCRAENLAGMAAATMVLAGNDPLHDEGTAYATALAAAGVAVSVHDYHAATHGFASYVRIVPIADAAVSVCAAALRVAFERSDA